MARQHKKILTSGLRITTQYQKIAMVSIGRKDESHSSHMITFSRVPQRIFKMACLSWRL